MASHDPETTFEHALARILSTGVLVSAGLLVLGMASLVVTGETGYPAAVMDFGRVRPGAYPHTLPALVEGVRAGKPLALVALGLLALILTPMLRVASSIVLFLKERDYLYVGISAGVLLMLGLGMALGAH